jgi:choline dehydrogenase-like flavoprotein
MWHRYVGLDGQRQDAAHRYIHPLLQDGEHPNLRILVESKVIRVLFDDSSPPKAVGVEYKTNEDAQPSVSLSKPIPRTVKANKLVVVSAGALSTPQILERSGIGKASILKDVGVNVVAEVPGVGENYQDHHLLLYPYRTNLPEEETLDPLLSGRKDFMKSVEAKAPIMGWNGIGMSLPIIT